mgnify:FL=1|jgi:hypothetical protein
MARTVIKKTVKGINIMSLKGRHEPILDEDGRTPREAAAVNPLEIAHQLDMMEQTLNEHLEKIANSLSTIAYWTEVANYDKERAYLIEYKDYTSKTGTRK